MGQNTLRCRAPKGSRNIANVYHIIPQGCNQVQPQQVAWREGPSDGFEAEAGGLKQLAALVLRVEVFSCRCCGILTIGEAADSSPVTVGTMPSPM